VHALRPLAGPGTGKVLLGFGQIVLVFEDHESQDALRRAVDQAAALSDWALPPG
jgi:hypothetical protein